MCHSEFPYAPDYESQSLTQSVHPDNWGFPQGFASQEWVLTYAPFFGLNSVVYIQQ